MRLSPAEVAAIVEVISTQLSPPAELLLYGSRVFDQAKGGDIDLVIFSDTKPVISLELILVRLKARIGDRKIDLRWVNREDKLSNPFWVEALKTSVLLKKI